MERPRKENEFIKEEVYNKEAILYIEELGMRIWKNRKTSAFTESLKFYISLRNSKMVYWGEANDEYETVSF